MYFKTLSRWRPQESKKSSPATGSNTIRGSHQDNEARDVSKIKRYNCQKKGHFANDCPEPRNEDATGMELSDA